MNTLPGVLTVATPCKQSWNEMKGDERVRHCGVCDKHVYSLDGLTTDEVRELIVRAEGKVCWRFFVRRDGTVLTKDCPVGLARLRWRARMAILASAAMMLAAVAGVLRGGGFWNASQALGSLSTRVSNSCELPPLIKGLRSHQNQQVMGGMAMVQDVK